MLAARRVPKACHSCRSQLLALFEHGFTQPTSIARYHTPQQLQTIRARSAPLRSFTSSTAQRNNGAEIPPSKPDVKDTDVAAPQTKDDIERVVRSARDTFGDTLPENFLSEDEYALYERLYGPPLRATAPSDLELFEEEAPDDGEAPRNVLLRETEDGEFEEVDFDPKTGLVEGAETEEVVADSENALASVDGEVQVQAHSQREANAILRLRKDMVAAMANAGESTEVKPGEIVEGEEEIDEEYDEEFDEADDMEEKEVESSDSLRTHPNTMAGRWGTRPSTVYLPAETFVKPITELLSRVNNKHLHEAAEKAFGGEGLPHGPATPYSKRLLPQKHIGLEATQLKMSEVEADAYMAVVMPGVYATVMSTLVEVRKRLGSGWLRDLLLQEGGPKVLDAGAGGAGAMAWQEVLQAEWDTMVDEGIVEGDDAPSSKTSVVTGPTTLRHRMSQLLENTTFLPRLPDHLQSLHSDELLVGGPQQPKKLYDVIIAPHTLLPLKDEYRRRNQVENLWTMLNPNGGVLILVEKGLPRGFEAIGGARDLLLQRHISSPEDLTTSDEIPNPAATQYVKEKGMIIAPCTNHTKCPMYLIPGESKGRKDFCHFTQRYIRPAFLQRILGAKGKNHEDIKFSYLAVRRGVDDRDTTNIIQGTEATNQAFAGHEPDHDPNVDFDSADVTVNPLSLPRMILTPLKRTGHVTMDLCTPAGKLERWTVPRSFSRQAYRDARKAAWGDLWALGAKTRVERTVRLGKDKNGKDIDKKKKPKKNVFEIDVNEKGWQGIREAVGKKPREGKRTKKGRVFKKPKEIGDDEF